jgi:hypothetical protein
MFGRRDGTLASIPPYRRMMPFLMRRKAESAVLFEQTIDVSATLQWLAQWNQQRSPSQPTGKATLFHVVLHAFARLLRERPNLNRFVVGKKIYDRRGVFLTFAAKKAMRDDAPIATVKREFVQQESFADLVSSLTSEIQIAKSDAMSRIDRELHWFLKLPSPLLSFAIGLLGWLDRRGLAPASLIAPDPMYTSVFLANLGSIGIEAAYHHLYEYGNCPLFVTIGTVATRHLPGDRGQLLETKTVQLRYTYDERIEDGFYCARSLEMLQTMIKDPGSWIDQPAK